MSTVVCGSVLGAIGGAITGRAYGGILGVGMGALSGAATGAIFSTVDLFVVGPDEENTLKKVASYVVSFFASVGVTMLVTSVSFPTACIFTALTTTLSIACVFAIGILGNCCLTSRSLQ